MAGSFSSNGIFSSLPELQPMIKNEMKSNFFIFKKKGQKGPKYKLN
jgi:hypothetical protein